MVIVIVIVFLHQYKYRYICNKLDIGQFVNLPFIHDFKYLLVLELCLDLGSRSVYDYLCLFTERIKALKTLVWHLSKKPMKQMSSLKKKK